MVTFMISVVILWTLAHASSPYATQLPRPTGPFNAGVRRFVKPYYKEHLENKNYWVPHIEHDYLVTVYYPTMDESEPAPYLQPEVAEMLEFEWAFERGQLVNLEGHRVWNASFLPEEVGPTLIFDGRFRFPPTDGNSILLSELASHGYTVVALDHPNEQVFIRMPNGTIERSRCPGVRCFGAEGPGYACQQFTVLHHNNKTLDIMEHWGSIVDEWDAPFAKDNFGLIGFEDSGSSMMDLSNRTSVAATVLIATMRLTGHYSFLPVGFGFSWLKYRGSKFMRKKRCGPEAFGVDIKKPALVLGGKRRMSHGYYLGATHPRAWFRWLVVEDAEMPDFMDGAIWKQWKTQKLSNWDLDHTPEAWDRAAGFGEIPGLRAVEVTNKVILAFFDRHMRNGPADAILDEPVTEYPEVLVRRGSFQTAELTRKSKLPDNNWMWETDYIPGKKCQPLWNVPRLNEEYYQNIGDTVAVGETRNWGEPESCPWKKDS